MARHLTRDLILWLSLLAGPVLWLISFQAKFAWVPLTCAAQSRFATLLFSILALALTAIAGTVAWRQWRALQNGSPEIAGPGLAASRFLALGAIAFSAGFFLVILAQIVPDVVLEACQ
ncbi:MAG TPA: hypothetical protein VH477_03140 [Bryobacteraceae bacterium]|jgi:hypothetical protein